MVIVVDASVALKWVLRESGGEAAWALQSETLIAPSSWIVEAGNALAHHVARGLLEPALAHKYLQTLIDGPVTSVAESADIARAFDLAVRLKHPIYDCVYLALALRHDTYVITADVGFVSACIRDGGFQKHVQLLPGA